MNFTTRPKAASTPPEPIKTVAIDIETYSPVDLTSAGVYPYAEHPEFEILLLAYAFNNEPPTCVDIARGEALPQEVRRALTDPRITKTAFNANFERVCIGQFFSIPLPIDQWECTMVRAAMAGLPMALDAAARVLLPGQQKMAEGKALIRYFCQPCLPLKTGAGPTRNLPEHAPRKWELFKAYCRHDVELEMAIRKEISFYPMPEQERRLYTLDQTINDRGVAIDRQLVRNAIETDSIHTARLSAQATRITGLSNPNSVAQLKQWIGRQVGENIAGLTKETIPEILKNTSNSQVIELLHIRQQMAKTSVKKYRAMEKTVCRDARVRGLLQFYGAGRTGRWAGRLVQVQNLPQNHLPNLDHARRLLKEKNPGELAEQMTNPSDTLSQLIRTAFVAKEGHTFVVADFAAIETRVIAWLADEKWRLDVFHTHGKIYEASAAAMFNVPIEEIGKDSSLRQKGKVAELALGYQGGPAALAGMGALKMGLTAHDLPALVNAWRGANPAIVRFWHEVGKAAIEAVEKETTVCIRHGIKFEYTRQMLFIELPSGRKLSYMRPRIDENNFAGKTLRYEAVNPTTKQWATHDTYGGKLTENIVQAVARDCLAHAMLRLESEGCKIVMHIHDEVVIEIEKEKADPQRICQIMTQTIPWAHGLPLRAEGYETPYYKK